MAFKDLCSREQLIQRVQHDFPDRVSEVMELLDQLELDSSDQFLRLAVLRLVNGRFDLIGGRLRTAQNDWRDLLVDVHREYGQTWYRGFVPSRVERWE